jgi:hypothetical protein
MIQNVLWHSAFLTISLSLSRKRLLLEDATEAQTSFERGALHWATTRADPCY